MNDMLCSDVIQYDMICNGMKWHRSLQTCVRRVCASERVFRPLMCAMPVWNHKQCEITTRNLTTVTPTTTMTTPAEGHIQDDRGNQDSTRRT